MNRINQIGVNRALSSAVLGMGVVTWASCVLPGYELANDGSGRGGSGSVSSSSTESSSSGKGGGGAAGTGGSGGSGEGGSGGSVGAGGDGDLCGPDDPSGAIACRQGNPSAIAVDDLNIYWTNEDAGTVMMASKVDLKPIAIVKGEDRPCGIATLKGNIYWRTRGGDVKSILSTTASGTSPTIIGQGKGDSCAIAVDYSALYWASVATQPYYIAKLEIENNEFTKFETVDKPDLLDVSSASTIFWYSASKKQLFHIIKANGSKSIEIGNARQRCGIAFGGQFLFTTSGQDGSEGVVERVNIINGDPYEIANGQSKPCAIAVTIGTSAQLFWLNKGNGEVMRINEGVLTTLAAGPEHPCALAVDETHVYWTTCGSGSSDGLVLRVPK